MTVLKGAGEDTRGSSHGRVGLLQLSCSMDLAAPALGDEREIAAFQIAA
jgi:hypothetical protein